MLARITPQPHSFLQCRKRSFLPLHNEIRGAVRPGGGGGRGRVPAEGGSRLHEGGHQAGAEHTSHPQGRGDPEGTGRYRAGGVRVDPLQPEDQPVRGPGRPGALRGHQQPAGADRPDRPLISNTLEAVPHADASSGWNQN